MNTCDTTTTAQQDTPQTRGWQLVRESNIVLKQPPSQLIRVRQYLAEYFKLGLQAPSSLHSAILSVATSLALRSADFHLVSFLDMWDISNLRPEDSESHTDESSRRMPSLVERMAKAYAYALLFHPDEHLAPELENILFPLIRHKGFLGTPGPTIVPLLATSIIRKQTNGRRTTFVTLISPRGNALVTEIHKLTAYKHLRQDLIPGTMFDTLLRTSDDPSKVRVEAAIVSRQVKERFFPQTIGYVEHIDTVHNHIHIYDRGSRHMVAEQSMIHPRVGDYVRITPIIPRGSNFKTALIESILQPGDSLQAAVPQAFGVRRAKVTHVDTQKGYAAWELLPDASGNITPIVETGTTSPIYTKGYIHQSLAQTLGKPLPEAGAVINIVTFLKRGKDKVKRPNVIDYEPIG